jgi:hypothetical protein
MRNIASSPVAPPSNLTAIIQQVFEEGGEALYSTSLLFLIKT